MATAAVEYSSFLDSFRTPGILTAALAADESLNPFEGSFGNSRYNDIRDKDSPYSATSDFQIDPINKSYLSHPKQQDRLTISTSDSWETSQPPTDQPAHIYASRKLPTPPNSAASVENDIFIGNAQQKINSNANYTATYKPNTPESSPVRNNFTAENQQDNSDEQFATRRQSRKRSSYTDSVEEPTTPKRKRKNTATSITSVNNERLTGTDGQKRKQLLERNRLAASKCREKKKVWVDGLEARRRELHAQHTQLMQTVRAMKDEVIFLKGKLLEHNSCNCHGIHEYLKNSAVSMVSESPSSADLGPSPNMEHRILI